MAGNPISYGYGGLVMQDDGSGSFLQKVQSSYQKLHAVAIDLNVASDQIGKLVGELDSALKKLNLGITVWVTVGSNEWEDGSFRSHDIGYAKIDGEWGISLRIVNGNSNNPDQERTEEWLFNDATRSLRLDAIGYIPALLEKLSEEAVKTTEEIKKKLSITQQITEVVTKMAAQPFTRSLPITKREVQGK
jgi:hypothetical protein